MKKFFLMSLSFFMVAGLNFAQDGTQQLMPFTYFKMAGNTHLVLVNMDFKNDGFFEPGQGTVHFTGNQSDSLLGNSGTNFYDLVIDKAVGANFYIPPELPIDGPWSVANQLLFVGNGNKIVLTKRDLICGPGSSIVGAGPKDFIVTTGEGRLIKEGITNFDYPVGSNENRFTPIRIEGHIGQNNIGVRCLPHVYSNGNSGIILKDGVIDVSWELSKSLALIADFCLPYVSWNASDELSGFDSNDCGISQSLGNGDWDLAGSNIGKKTGQGPFKIGRCGIQLKDNNPVVFTVGSERVMYPLRISPKTYLQGAFNLTTGLMEDNLRANQLLPLKEPYSGMSGFQHVGRGGDESVSPSVFDKTGLDAIVDWVFLELRAGANSNTVLETRSALIQRNGQIVDVDGISPPTFRGRGSDSYYVTIKHRNHLGIRTPKAFQLMNDPVLTYDFSDNQYNTLNGIQAKLGDLGWGMYGGNANSNSNIRYSGPNNDQNQLLNFCLGGFKRNLLNAVYNNCDLNMDGTLLYSGPLNDKNVLLNTVLAGDKTKVIIQPKF